MDLITKNLILLDQDVSDKQSLLTLFGTALKSEERINDFDLFLQDVMDREALASTAIGDSIALPHAISSTVSHATLVFIRLSDEIKWNSEDKIRYVFGIAVPKENKDNQHLKILSSLARQLLHDEFKNSVLHANNVDECYELLSNIKSTSQD